MSGLFLLSERQMARIAPFFPLAHGVPRVDDRRVVSGIIYVIKHSLQWKDAPHGYGPHKTRRMSAASISLTRRCGKFFQKLVVALERRAIAVLGPIRFEHNLRHLSVLGPACRDPFGPSGATAVRRHCWVDEGYCQPAKLGIAT